MMNKKIGKALVVGAGVGGIRSALDLAEVGYGVTLIDRSPHMGGILSQLDYQFPTDRCGMCKMLPLVDRDASSQYCLRKGLFHENIEILLSTELASVEGEPGNFNVTLRQKPNWVDPSRCIGCGDCVAVCPVEVPDRFNADLSNRKAIYLPIPHAIPNTYVIDLAACTRCGECEKVCPTDAIRLSDQKRKEFRILVVDDELIVRDSLKEWLAEEEGFSVDTAASGPEALAKLEKLPYQLMLLDIKMPEMDGVEVIKRAKDKYPDLDVVMITAYATVETAVEAMKTGALDYIIKPFDPEVLIPKIIGIYEALAVAHGRQLNVGALVLSGGTDFFDPVSGRNTFGYGLYPGVVTSIEFERILSGTGPSQGRLKRPVDGKTIRKVAWIQCVGSRDLQNEADMCSNICCMFSIKEALLAKEKAGKEMDTTIFYMDMRTFGKSFQAYREQAENEQGVRFIRGRVHSVIPYAEGDSSETAGDLLLRYTDHNGERHKEFFDMVVLAVGQRPATGSVEMAGILGLQTNPWGFVQTEPFSMNLTDKAGIVVGGSFSGLKDISESVVQASASSLNASRVIHAAGGSLAPESMETPVYTDVSREIPRILIVLCTCGEGLDMMNDQQRWAEHFSADIHVISVEFVAHTCTAEGWTQLETLIRQHQPNRVLIGACLPYVYVRKLKELSETVNLDLSLMDIVDIRTPAFVSQRDEKALDKDSIFAQQLAVIEMGLARLKRMEYAPLANIPVKQTALTVGGGIAGMTAALAIADHGYEVHLVEQNEQLGGNLIWLKRTLEGHATDDLLAETIQKVEKHPLIHVYTGTRVVNSFGQVGHFLTTIEDAEAKIKTLEHGVTVLATGGSEAVENLYEYGASESIVTQKELQTKLSDSSIDAAQLESVVMIQCVGSREHPRNYCSRICCASAIKNALHLKKENPDMAVYVLYRDMMTYGFNESYFTQARKENVIFIQYHVDDKPTVKLAEGSGGDEKPLSVAVYEPIIRKKVEIDADLVVLATGIVPTLPTELAAAFGVDRDQYGFFSEAESKWRPVDAFKEGVFACGLSHSPRSITEAIATAEASAQRALRILSRERLPGGKVVAGIHTSLCSLCERCIEACPYGARTLTPDQEKIEVNPVMCQGCGSCATACPNSASYLEGFTEQQMLDVIDAALI
jgi:heterodisulfide reductase subunit A